MKRTFTVLCALAALCAVFVLASTAEAGTVHGTVKNGTTGKPGAGVEVILIQLQGGMQPVANTKSDAQGQFTFDNPNLGTQPMLVRAVYNGVNFHQPVPPGGLNAVEVQIFEPSKDPKTISIGSRIVFFQPHGSMLTVDEEYSVDNNSNPPHAFFSADGNFEFSIPDKAQLQQVAAAGPTGMPVMQAPIDKTKNRYAIAYAFRPGQSQVRFSYELPYPDNAATVKVPITHATQRLVVVASPLLKISGDGLQPQGQEQGMSIYSRDNLQANTAFAVNVSGTAPPMNAGGGGADQGQGGQGRDEQSGAGAANSAEIQVVPGRLDTLQWPLLGLLAVVFTGLAIVLSYKKVVAVPVIGVADVPEQSAARTKTAASKAAVSEPAAAHTPNSVVSTPSATVKTPATATATMASLDAAVGNSLDALKERIFRLELRRQAGTISEEDYAKERARAEEILRELVRG